MKTIQNQKVLHKLSQKDGERIISITIHNSKIGFWVKKDGEERLFAVIDRLNTSKKKSKIAEDARITMKLYNASGLRHFKGLVFI